MLVVQEKSGRFRGTGIWKFPTGVVDEVCGAGKFDIVIVQRREILIILTMIMIMKIELIKNLIPTMKGLLLAFSTLIKSSYLLRGKI